MRKGKREKVKKDEEVNGKRKKRQKRGTPAPRFCRAHERDNRQTDTQTDHATPCVAACRYC